MQEEIWERFWDLGDPCGDYLRAGKSSHGLSQEGRRLRKTDHLDLVPLPESFCLPVCFAVLLSAEERGA